MTCSLCNAEHAPPPPLHSSVRLRQKTGDRIGILAQQGSDGNGRRVYLVKVLDSFDIVQSIPCERCEFETLPYLEEAQHSSETNRIEILAKIRRTT